MLLTLSLEFKENLKWKYLQNDSRKMTCVLSKSIDSK